MYELEWFNSNAPADCQAQFGAEALTLESARIDAQFYADRDGCEVDIFHRPKSRANAKFLETVVPRETE